ncbi:MAG: 4-hydroxybutyryl-CoA dehydratase [Deltaproteobacteria bacterium]|nr:4-hydroxybutyryl-CoA dehydratase [Deltaproteobacteria bacterium]
MAVLTSEEYIDRLRKQKVNGYMAGDKIGDIVDDPRIRVGINAISTTFDAANDPAHRDLVTLESPLINEKINRWTHILEDEQDAIAKAKSMRQVGGAYGCPCVYRCIGNDLINTAWAVSYDIDKKYGTHYHQNVVDIVKEVQKKDLVIGGTIVDPKGDRVLRPSQQPDPDVYLHVVEKKSDGIIVRGGKAHSTAALYTDMLCAAPSYPLRENEKEFALGFFCPLDAEGITFMCRPATAPLEPTTLENPLGKKYGHAEIFVVYDDVFIPWESVFMCGEYDFTIPLITVFTANHMLSKCGCRSASMELDIGATALIAEVNGAEKATHINDYMNEMIMNTEMVYACAMAAAINGEKHESGVFIPDLVPTSAGKAFAARKLGEHRYFMQDSAGGLVQTMVNEKDYLSPKTGKMMEKYYKAKPDVPTENRVRAFKLVEDLTSSPIAGWYHAMCISGGGGPQMLKQGIRANYDVESLKQRAKKIAGIE